MAGRRASIRLADLSPDVQHALKEAGIETVDPTNKFHVVPKAERTHLGILFDSRIEMEVYRELLKHFPKKRVHLQPVFELQPPFEDCEGKSRQAVLYKGDFLIGPARRSAAAALRPDQHVIDVKGMITPEFLIKEKLFAFKYARLIVTVRSIKELYVKLLQAKLIQLCQTPSKLQRSLAVQSPKEKLLPSEATSLILERLQTTESASSESRDTSTL